MELPLVSVVLCCYNGAMHLASQVNSILDQTYRNIELIIADDASTDDTRSVLREFEQRERVRIIGREKNLGLAANFYDAALQSKGDFIAFSDQDDIWLPGKIETLLSNIGSSPLVYSDSLLVDESGKSMAKKLSGLRTMYSGDDSRGYVFYSCVWGHGMLVTRQLLLDSRPFPSGIHHDIWLAFCAFSRGGIKYHDEVLTLYRQHTASTSKTLPQKMESRKKEQRHQDFLKQLNWIGLMRDNERKEFKVFYEKLYNLYAMKSKGKYVYPLFRFLLSNRKPLFMYSKKNLLSQFVEIAKQAKGESS